MDLDVNQKNREQVTFNSQEVYFGYSFGEVPSLSDGSGRPARREHGQDFTQSLADVFQFRGGARWKRQRGLFSIPFDLRSKVLAGAGDGKTFFVKEFLDAQNALYILMTVHSLSGTAFHRLKLGKFSFPETQNVGGEAAETGDFTDAKVKFLWDHHVGGPCRLGDGSGAQAHRDSGSYAGRGKKRIFPTRVSSTTGLLAQP